jgi:transposase
LRFHRYRCQKCGHTFNENITFKYPGTRVTSRAALWIKILLMHQMTIKAVSDLTGIHWGTVSKIHKEIMDEALKTRSEELRKSGYRPKHLAVDEFAMHKGHTYATCVMDLDMETSSGLVRDAL